ncbi:MAG: tRNA (guanosine(46)-N7)-methyltransferase TrmB [Muribaculum sp.]|nr:tRNA (guanosine(46)-N7)-methyltransferase TrmB [Muribaculaceae bacterium]MCM1081667.1 tRNA (guanosine(46)-N7)-methyltransferase TrmB [Muribaculum sp.]
MGKNKLKKFSDIAQMDCVVECPFAMLNSDGFHLRGKWNTDFFKNKGNIILELGCGKGEYTVGLARQHPECNFIGIDIKGARLWTGAKDITQNNITNAAFLRTTIDLLPKFFSPGEVSEIWITFPDPQMKKENKRLTGARFMQMYRQVLAPGAKIKLKTDSPFLFNYTLAMARHNNLTVNESCADLHNDSSTPDELRLIRTFYEQQWLDRGLTIKYINMTVPDESAPVLAEPDIDIPFDTYRSYSRGEIPGQEPK